MRRKYIFLIYIIIFCLLAGCNGKADDTKPAVLPLPETEAEKPTDDSQLDIIDSGEVKLENGAKEPQNEEKTGSSTDSAINGEEQKKQKNSEDEDKGRDTVVVKTESEASDKEAEEVLNQLDKELDKIIDALDSLNDVSEEDIDF